MESERKKTGTSKRYALVAIALLLLPVAVFSCHHYYEKSVTKAQIDLFCLSTKVLFAEELEADENLAKAQKSQFHARLNGYSIEHPVLPEAYALNGHAFRFIQAHQPTEHQNIATQRFKALLDDGIDLSTFGVAEHAKSIAQLSTLNQNIGDQSQVVFPESELSVLYENIQAESKKQDKTFTPLEILEFCLATENAGKYPSLQKAWSEVYSLAQSRSVLEANLEADTAAWYFILLQHMLIKPSLFLANWKLFESDPQKALAQLEPKFPHYADLKKGLIKYRQYAQKPYEAYTFASKSNTKIKQGGKGADGDLAMRIKKRLALEGYWSGDFSDLWDSALTEALTKYQENHQVVPDGVYGRGTAKSFNFSIEERINQIRLAMQRIRESAARWGDYYIWINIPEMAVEVHENQKIIRKHKIIVGNLNPKNHTPEFSDEVELINFNPSWFVPERIIKEEMQPGFDKDEDFFKKKGYHFKTNDEGKVLAVTQPPGGGNALGIVKILFPNHHDVYLHDTPTKYLFKRTVRAFSHGCMRLHNAVDMAKFLLEKDQHPDLDQVDEILTKRSSKELFLKNKVPIHINYVIASSNENGEVVFFGDVYKREKDTLMAMNP